MIIFPGMIAEAAKQAGMKTPENPDDGFDAKEYPHFNIYCAVQLGRAIRWGEHWENAKVVARIPNDKLETVTLQDLIEDGLEFHQ